MTEKMFTGTLNHNQNKTNYKAGGLPMAEKLTELFQCMWRKEAIPQDFKDASIIHLYKRKGNPQVCDNHRGISLLSIAGKILGKFY